MNWFTAFSRARPDSTPTPPGVSAAAVAALPGERIVGGTEIGQRSTPEGAAQRLYRSMWVDPNLRMAILQIRNMDRLDGRVKKIHARTSRAAAKGGLILKASGQPKRLQREWDSFTRRLHLNRRAICVA